jgi:uncharacterized iron-regulated membrane protein
MLLLDPYSGAVVSDGPPATRRFFHAVTDLHRYLGASGDARDTGKAVTGAANLAFLFLVLSGVYLWWRARSVSFGRGFTGRARDFNWHHVIGFWSALPLAAIVVTGAVMSYAWANDLLYRLSGTEPPARSTSSGSGPSPTVAIPERLDELWTIAAERAPGWNTLSVRFAAANAPVAFTIDHGNGARPDLKSTLSLDPASAAVVRSEPYESLSRGRQVRAWARYVHTGEAGGFAGQTLAMLASAGAVVLAWTGAALAWSRFRSWRTRKSALAAAA